MELIKEYGTFLANRYPDVLSSLWQHLSIVALAVLFGCIVAISTAILLTRIKEGIWHSFVFTIANIFQTVPTIALLAILIPIIGIGMTPAVVALFLYSLLPLLRNTYSGINEVDEGVVESAKGMGYSSMQRLWKIELPLAFPYILSGIRLTTVYIISWTTLAALIGAGGLGDLIMAGMSINDNFLIFTGAATAVILALVVDLILGLFSKQGERSTL